MSIGEMILDYSKEKILTQDFDVPHFLTHYPKIAKPFYHRVDPSDDKYVLCHDLLAPEGYGEIIGGRKDLDRKEILQRIDEEGTPREPYQFYIDVRSMVESLTVALASVSIVSLVGWQERLTYAKSYHSHVLLAVSTP